MRVVQAATSPAGARRLTLGRADAALDPTRVERLGLALTTIVLGLGLFLVYTEQTADVAGVTRAVSAGTVVDLGAAANARDLLPALPMFADATERARVAEAIYNRARSKTLPRVEHVGALAGLPVPVAALQRTGSANTAAQLTAGDVAAIKPLMIVRTPAAFRRQMAQALGLFVLAFWLVHLLRTMTSGTGDPLLLPIVHLLTGLGLMTMIALRDPLRDMMIANTAARGVIAGCAIWAAVRFIDFEQPRLRRAVLEPLAVAVLLAAAVVIFGGGPTGSGAKVNLLGVQPVEAVRLLVVFSLAAYFARRWQFLREFSEPIGNRRGPLGPLRMPRWKDVRPLAISIGTLLAFFFLQKDLGPALVLSCVFLGLYGMSRGRGALVASGFAVLIIGFTIGYALGVPATVTRRVAIWLDPWDNALPRGDQIAHGLWALASGGPWGLGPGVGDPQLIPAGHTDLVLAAVGEELGVVGVLSIVALFVLLVWRLLRIALRAPGDYTAFLAAGLALALAVQALVIVGGLFALMPLAGVVTPFLSYGRSAMLSNFAAVAICAAISRRAGPARVSFAAPVRVIGALLGTGALSVALAAVVVQVVRADTIATRPNLTEQADGGFRYQYNPRLVAAARQIVRGTIFDRSGLPLATSRPGEIDQFVTRWRKLGVTLPDECHETRARCYPLGGVGFHLLGDASRQTNWAARNTSFLEKDLDARLKGYDDRPQTIEIRHPRTGAPTFAIRRDFTPLLPLVRHKADLGDPAVQRILNRERDVHTTIDAGLQLATARAVRDRATAAGSGRGAAVVIDPATGDLLASVSYPWPEASDSDAGTIAPERLLDRARYGLYTPGSTFKLVTAVAALRTDPSEQRTNYMCVRLPDGRVGGNVANVSHPIRDDALDHVPHGEVDLRKALIVSCNAYFANLANRIGAEALAETAAQAQIAAAPPPVLANLRRTLPFAGYGQGDVLVSPLRMARVAGAIAVDGSLRDVRVVADAKKASPATRWVSASGAARLRSYMREAVTSGTGQALAANRVPIAGKTGTAEIDGAPSHSWFTGFAPAGNARRRIAFAVIVENAGYGGRSAAPLAGDIVTAAAAQELIR